MAQMSKLGMYFLSRIKSDSVFKLIKVMTGIDRSNEGKYFSDLCVPDNQEYIEFTADFGKFEGLLVARVIGFWNTKENKHHW